MTASRTLLIVLLGLLSTACGRLAEPAKPLDLKFTAIDGRPVDLAQLRGKVVLIDFWATWCAPCKIITPDILALYKKYHDQGFDVVGMSVDTDKKAAQDYIAKEGIPWPEFFDDTGKSTLVEDLGVDSFPTLWLVGKNGAVVDRNFRDQWANGDTAGIPTVTPPQTLDKIGAAIQKQLQAP